MVWFSWPFGKKKAVAYYTWHLGGGAKACEKCRDLDGTCWLPSYDFDGPPLKKDCLCPGGCTCRVLVVRMDEAWGPGNAEWIGKRGGLVTGAQMDKFLSN